MEEWISGTGQRVMVHDKADCKGRNCSIHNPSDHIMKDWPLHWRDDRGLMERICPHGVGHPDPDDLAFKKNVLGWSDKEISAEAVHGCCSCYCGESIRIKGFTKYFITPDGGVWNNKLKKFMKLQEKSNYLWVQLNENGKRKFKAVHRLVGEAYILNPENKRCINHKDFNTFNNKVENLEWVTDSENLKYSYDNGRRDNIKYAVSKNANKNRRKFSKEDINKIFQMRKNKILIKDIANELNVHRETISRIIRGITYKEFYNG